MKHQGFLLSLKPPTVLERFDGPHTGTAATVKSSLGAAWIHKTETDTS